MALFKSTIAASISGSIAGLTFSHNSGGVYIRERVIPTDPGAPLQVLIRAIMTALANRWANVLTPVQRATWDLYAANVPRPNALGDFRLISGIAHYVRSNTPRLQFDPTGVGLPVADTAPSIFDVGEYTTPTAAATAPASTADITFNTGDAWVGEDQAAMLIWFSRPQNLSINFFKGPYRQSSGIFGNLALPPTSPDSQGLPFPTVAGQGLFFRANVTRSDGRLSNPIRRTVVIT